MAHRPGWSGLVAEFPLAALPAGDALRLLRARGLDELQARRANEFARGHPLALELAAAAVRAEGGRLNEVAAPVPTGLLDTLLDGLPATTVSLVEAASTLRRITEPILAAVLDVDDARAAFDALRGLPFVEPGADGLHLHDVVRDTVGRDLAVRNPEARRTYRRRAARFFTDQAGSARGHLWQLTADLVFLIENAVVRDSCFPSVRPDYVVEPARPEDGDSIARITARHESPAAAGALARWWSRHPETFAVARGEDRSVAAFVQIAELGSVDPALLADDPVARPWCDHLRAAPVAADDRVLLMRRWLGRDSGELRSPPVSACWLDVKRVYMELRPRLRRLYSTVVDLPQLGPIFLPLGFAPLGAPVELDGSAHQAVWLDFGPRQRRRVAEQVGRCRDCPGPARYRFTLRALTARARRPGAARRRSVQPRHRVPALHQREDGWPARVQHLRQARGALPRVGGAARRRARTHPQVRRLQHPGLHLA